MQKRDRNHENNLVSDPGMVRFVSPTLMEEAMITMYAASLVALLGFFVAMITGALSGSVVAAGGLMLIVLGLFYVVYRDAFGDGASASE